MVGVMRDLEHKLEKQVQETITLKEIVRDQEKQIRKMEAMMTTQTTMLQQIMSAVIPGQVPIQDDSTSEQTEPHHIIMWQEVANALKVASVERFFFLWHDLEGEKSFQLLDQEAKKPKKATKSRYSSAIRFMCELSNQEIEEKPHDPEEISKWKNMLTKISSEVFKVTLQKLMEKNCIKFKDDEEPNKVSFRKFHQAMVTYKRITKKRKSTEC